MSLLRASRNTLGVARAAALVARLRRASCVSPPALTSAPLDCIVGIETSCDDTGVAVVGFPRGDGAARAAAADRAVVLAEAVASQAALHAPFAGVVPHFAARAHEANLPVVLRRTLAAAGVGDGTDAASTCVGGRGRRRIVAVAVTVGPGLHMCLRAGVSAASALAARLRVPLLPIHHLEAHLLVARLAAADAEAAATPPLAGGSSLAESPTEVHRGGERAGAPDTGKAAPAFPYLVLLVSGGHTLLALARGVGRYDALASTGDDALGEAFDKAARLLQVWRHLPVLDRGAAAAAAGGIVPALSAGGLDGPPLRAATADHPDSRHGASTATVPLPRSELLTTVADMGAEAVASMPRTPPYAAPAYACDDFDDDVDGGNGAGGSARGGSAVPMPDDALLRRMHATHAHLGAALEALARHGDDGAVRFPVPLSTVWGGGGGGGGSGTASASASAAAFSFAGLKSAMQRHVLRPDVAAVLQRRGSSGGGGGGGGECNGGVVDGGGPLSVDAATRPTAAAIAAARLAADLAAGFQLAAARHLAEQLARAAAFCDHGAAIMGAHGRVADVVVCGGAAANAYLRRAVEAAARAAGLRAFFPRQRWCVDNGVMVAYAGAARYGAGDDGVPPPATAPAGVTHAPAPADGAQGRGLRVPPLSQAEGTSALQPRARWALEDATAPRTPPGRRKE